MELLESLHFNLRPCSKFAFLVWNIAVVLPAFVNSVGIGMMKEKQPGWVRFCSGEEYFDVFANQCPSGFFWKPEFKVNDKNWDCVCARGPWRRSNKWCSNEDSQRFIQGDVSCFEPDQTSNMEGMLYLGDQYSMWDSGTPILLTSFTSGITIRQEDFNKKWKLPTRKNDDPGILISRPRDDWTVEDQNNPKIRLCLRAPPPTFDDTSDGIFIYNVSTLLEDGGSTDFKLAFTRTCFSWDKDDGKTWYEIIGESIDDKNLIVPRYENTTASSACQRCMADRIPDPPTQDVYGITLKAAERRTMDDLKHVGVLTSEINLQTERLGLYWANRLLRDETDYVKENLQEVEILTKAAILAYGTCDLNFIPKPFYQYFLLMFRRLLSESFKKYAPASPITPEYYSKIGELLNKCMERTKKIDFIVDKSCPPMYTSYKSSDGEKPIPKGKTDYNAKPAKHDYLLEFIWRLKSFLHYNCFPEFMEDSILHDLMQNQLESLFTEDVLLRWFNPSKAFKMYELIFKMHLDLKATMGNFERCVRAVHEMSKYPVWLTRPIDQPHRVHSMSRKKRSVETDNAMEEDNAMSLESEYEDMAIESIRQKREDEPEDDGKIRIDINEKKEDEKTKENESETEKPETENTDNENDTEDSKTDNENKETNKSGESETENPNKSGESETENPNKSGESETEKPNKSGESETENPNKSGESETEKPNKSGESETENPNKSGESETENPNKSGESETENPNKSGESEATSEAPSTDNKDNLSGESTTDAADKEGAQTLGETTGAPKPTLILPDDESGEMMYTDSSEVVTRGREDTVWNKFTIPGTQGFAGACIESMSTFTKIEEKDFASCW